jgi:hypothetical protein
LKRDAAARPHLVDPLPSIAGQVVKLAGVLLAFHGEELAVCPIPAALIRLKGADASVRVVVAVLAGADGLLVPAGRVHVHLRADEAAGHVGVLARTLATVFRVAFAMVFNKVVDAKGLALKTGEKGRVRWCG